MPWYAKTVVLLIVLVLGQQLIPTGSVSRSLKVDGVRADTLGRALPEVFDDTSRAMTVRLGDDTVVFAPRDAGIHVDASASMKSASPITSYHKLVPVLPIVKLLAPRNTHIIKSVDASKQQAFAQSLAKQYSRSPQDASIALTAGELKIQKEIVGQTFTAESIISMLRTMDPVTTRTKSLHATATNPTITTAAFTTTQKNYDVLSAQELTIQYGKTTKRYPAETVRKWLVLSKDETKNAWSFDISQEAISTPLAEWAREYNVPAGTTQVTLIDDIETGRRSGASGRELDQAAVVGQIRSWVLSPKAEAVVLASKSLAPKVVVTRYYSASSAGLQAKLNAWIAGHGGTYQVAIQELGGQGRQASYNVQQQTVMASTYKLFVAFAVYRQSEIGALSLTTKLSTSSTANGKTIESCIADAIVTSDNDCAIALGKYVGWDKCDQIVAAAGFQNVKLNNYDSKGNLSGDKMVNANELAKFLAQLSGGTLMNSSNTSKLLGYMKQQTYRQGIPAGSRGSVVADKVGFLEGYLHDAAIVYSPDSTYALVIMSSGSSWSNISNLAAAVYDFMNQ